MIKDILNANENITAATAAENKLKAALPQCFDKDGKFCLEKLQELLKRDISADENYELNFLGKSYGRLLQAMETDTVIMPDEEHNSLPQNANSENLYITGDNLDALKHLLKSYENKIKCIYIDPPYNTGSDGFVYNDRFSFTKETLMQKLSVNEEKAERILELTTRGSASHSAWLTFMYPRLLLARDLLTDDGIIFISIDDNEQANLKLLCDDVFGEENNIGNLPTIMNLKGNQDEFGFAGTHEYILCYGKNKNKTIINLLKNDENIDDWLEDEIGYYKKGATLKRTGIDAPREKRPFGFYPILIKNERIFSIKEEEYNKLYNAENREFNDAFIENIIQKYESQGYVVLLPKSDDKNVSWRWKYTKVKNESNDLIIVKDSNNNYSLYKKQRPDLGDLLSVKPKSVLYKSEYSSGNGTSQIKNLFNIKLFDNPKPIELLKDLIILGMVNGSIILDFFSGSATTAHAVMQLNAEDGGNRKFILVQLPEATKADSEARRAGYETIDQIGRERIKRAAAKIKEEHPDTTADLGFKHFRLNQLNSMQLSQIETFSPELNLVGSDDLLQNFGMATVLTTWLNRDGYGLNPSVKVENLANYIAYICGTHIYLLENNFDTQALMELCRRYEEDNDFAKITNIIVFGYSFSYTELQALQDNIKKFSVTRNSRINVEIRY